MRVIWCSFADFWIIDNVCISNVKSHTVQLRRLLDNRLCINIMRVIWCSFADFWIIDYVLAL